MFKELTDKQVIKILLTSLVGMKDQQVEAIRIGKFHDSDFLNTLIKATEKEIDRLTKTDFKLKP